VGVDINLLHREGPVAFRPNYNRDRAERDRMARARAAEKQKKKEEKTAQRKALRSASEAPPDESVTETPTNSESKES
jgi:hypothetical protein